MKAQTLTNKATLHIEGTMVNFSVTPETRYTQVSDFLVIPELAEALQILRDNVEDKLKVFVPSEPELDRYIARKALDYMDETGISHDAWGLYDVYIRQDLRERDSFHVKKGHPVPKTGSRNTLKHCRVELKGNRDWLLQHTVQGEICSICSNWVGLFSYSKCMEIAKATTKLLPKNVHIREDIEAKQVSVEINFPELDYKSSVVLRGQGKVEYIPESLERIAEGKACLVKDNMYDTFRPGILRPEGYFWQLS